MPDLKTAPPETAALLVWFDENARDLPWRVPPRERLAGHRPDPYRVWLSEVMLQQTTVAAVKGYFARFTEAWPDVRALAHAEEDAVRRAWAGLGYYARCANLIRTARILADAGGVFPGTAAELAALPGIGAYTSAAIAAIAFDEPIAVVDGNVERVVTRLRAIETPLPAAREAVRAAVAALVPQDRPGAFAEAMMDLGATVCTPRNPRCEVCPLSAGCAAFSKGASARYPVKAPKVKKPERQAVAYVIRDENARILVVKRPQTGLLSGMTGLPSSAFTEGPADPPALPVKIAQERDCGSIVHVFTHFRLTLEVRAARAIPGAALPEGWRWSEDAEKEALPTVFRKALTRALAG